jgi:hypothetical protein
LEVAHTADSRPPLTVGVVRYEVVTKTFPLALSKTGLLKIAVAASTGQGAGVVTTVSAGVAPLKTPVNW